MASGDSWLTGMGADFPQKDVVVVHREPDGSESRTTVRGSVLSDNGMFDLNTPIWEGDVIEMEDPRGGIRQVHVTKVDINDVRGDVGFHGMSHIQVHWSDRAPRTDISTATYSGPVVQISGGHTQIAWGNRDVRQDMPVSEVAPGWAPLADAVVRAVQLLGTDGQVHPEDREVAAETGSDVLAQLAKHAPDRSIVRRGVATLRGLMMTAAGAASTEAGKSLIAALVLPDASPTG